MRGRNQHLILLAVLSVFTLVGITQPALAKTKINICALQDISTQVALKILKESNPVDVAEYAVARGIDNEPAFAWWSEV